MANYKNSNIINKTAILDRSKHSNPIYLTNVITSYNYDNLAQISSLINKDVKLEFILNDFAIVKNDLKNKANVLFHLKEQKHLEKDFLVYSYQIKKLLEQESNLDLLKQKEMDVLISKTAMINQKIAKLKKDNLNLDHFNKTTSKNLVANTIEKIENTTHNQELTFNPFNTNELKQKFENKDLIFNGYVLKQDLVQTRRFIKQSKIELKKDAKILEKVD